MDEAQTLLHPGYFGPIDQFCVYLNTDRILWENEDSYQKQTYRNRQYIYGANGKLSLNIPVTHARIEGKRSPYKEVKIENDTPWQSIHWKSLESAYRTSPFFEFYEHDIKTLYGKPYTYLLDFNYACWETLINCLQIIKVGQQTTVFHKTYEQNDHVKDYRSLTVAKRKPFIQLPVYDQVFQEKHGFIPNLSVLDLLFNQGPETLFYLEEAGKRIP